MGNDQVSQVDRRGQLAVIPASTAGADPRSFRIQSAFTPFQKWQRFTATGMTLA